VERRVITLTPDYSAPSPLWNEAGACLNLTVVGLPTDLTAALLRWQHHFDEHFHLGPG
jgi:hypothetical protein